MRALIKIGLGMLLLALVLIGISTFMLRAKGVNNPASAAGRVMRGESGLDVGDQVRVELLSTDAARGFIDFAAVSSKTPTAPRTHSPAAA